MENIEAIASPEEVHLVVGGYRYYLDSDDLLRYPDSYFAHMLKDEWNKDKTAAVTIDRNGRVFRYISYYLFSGYMDPNRKPIFDLDVLIALRTEADFYGLSELVRMCDSRIRLKINRVVSSQNSLGLSCFCVRAIEEKATDELVEAMNVFRPATTATSRLERYQSDCLPNNQNVAVLLKMNRQGSSGLLRECSYVHKCFSVGGHGITVGTDSRLSAAFSKWPLKMQKTVSRVCARDKQVFIYETGGSCVSRVPTSQVCHHGIYVYIFNSEHTGGRITTKVNGEEVSIEKPGECMALLPGCSYSVETVTSGHMVLFEYTVRFHYYVNDEEFADSDIENCELEDESNEQEGEGEYEGDYEGDEGDYEAEGEYDCEGEYAYESAYEGAHDCCGSDADFDDILCSDDDNDSLSSCNNSKPLVWQVHGSHSTSITKARSAALTNAINAALETYAGVVICLSTYYPAGHSSNKNRRCETDLTTLKGFDGKLHAHLNTLYEVTAVTVAVNTDKEGGGSTARVLDFPQDADMQLKVVAPMQSVSLDRGKSKTMLITGLLCFVRSSEKV